MAERPRLNADIFFVIISHLGAPELAKFSATCKLLHIPALKRLLSSDIRVCSNQQLLGLCICVLSDAPVRGLWVKNLWLAISSFQWRKREDPYSYPDIADTFSVSMLAAVIRASRNLRVLCIPHLCKVAQADRNIIPAIASLPHLVELELHELDPYPQDFETMTVLAGSMQSQLRVLRVHHERDGEYRAFPLDDPTSFKSLASVETLHLYNTTYPSPRAPSIAPWPSVRTLVIHDTWFNFLDMHTAFPALTHIELGPILNIIPRPAQISAALWDEMDTFKCTWEDVPDIHWARRSSIRRIDIDIQHCTFPGTFDLFARFLRETRPTVLSMEPIDVQIGEQFWRDISENPDLRCLRLGVIPTLISDNVALMVSASYFVSR